jgi:hypothetical protein
MRTLSLRHALYYPFHLCHEQTLDRLLAVYASIHFRDYMALQLTAWTGTTAYKDRMGDYYPDVVNSGRLVQGYPVSGPLDVPMAAAVDRDLSDAYWRTLFHGALREDRRFQRGLFDLSHGMLLGGTMVPGPAAWLRLIENSRMHQPCSVETLRNLSTKQIGQDQGYEYEYALALVKTSASLAYTIRLAIRHDLEAVTDSEPHYRLLERTRIRDHINLCNGVVPREGY